MAAAAAAVRGGAWGAGHGKSGAPITRGCFLLVAALVVVVMVVVVEETSALSITSRQPFPALSSLNVRFRGVRSAFMHPTATSFSPPIRNNNAAHRPQSFGGGSISSSLMPPGVASRAPATRTQEQGPVAPGLSPPQPIPRPHSRPSGTSSHPQKPTFVSFGADRSSEPRQAMWSRPQASATARGSSGGWAGMDGPAVHGRRASLSGIAHPRSHLSAGLAGDDPATTHTRHDTFGHEITEGLSHLNGRPSGRWDPRSGASFSGSSDSTRPVFGGGYRQPTPWHVEEEEEMVVEDEGVRNIFDLNTTTEYEPDDYISYHYYDQDNHTARSPEHTSSTTHDNKPLTLQKVMRIMNLASQADLHALLEQRGTTFDELREFLDSGARRKQVLEFLKPPPPTTHITTTTTSSPELSHHSIDTLVIEEGYQGTDSLSEDDHKGEGDGTEQDNKEQTKRNRKKSKDGKGGRRRKNKRRKDKKKQRENMPSIVSSPVPPTLDTTPLADPDPWTPSTPRTLPEGPMATTVAATGDTLLPTTQPPASETTVTSPPSVRTSEVSIVSVSVEEAHSDPHHKTPVKTVKTTVVEDVLTKRPNTHNITHPWEDGTPTKFPRPGRPSREPDQTMNEIEKVNFVREEQRDEYVFPLRGLLIISGLMGALAVFTLVILISYAVIKCSKKPVVNNYQVSEQQKPAGT